MRAVERLIQEAQALPVEEQQQLVAALSRSAKSKEQAARDAAVERAMGSMAGRLPSTEQMMAWKREEVELEEQRYERLFGNRSETRQ